MLSFVRQARKQAKMGEGSARSLGREKLETVLA